MVGFVLIERNTNQQEQALLQSNTNQAADFASESLNAVGSLFSSAAGTVKSTNGSPSAFAHAEAGLPLTMLLVKKTGAAYVVTAASGKGFHTGQVLGGAVQSTVEGARSTLTTGPVTFNGKLSTARFALGGSTVPAALIVYGQLTLNPFTTVSLTTGKPFEHLRITLYGPGPVTTHNLLVSTSSSLPLRGPSARASVAVGSSEWTLVAVARQPFIGGFAKSSPIILLVLGLLMAIIIGIAIEILARRRDFAETLVDERTATLEEALKERGHLQEAEQRAREGAEAANRSKNVFISRMSHELRTPLNAVIGFGQLLELDGLTDDQRDSVDHILRGGRHLLGLINEVLDIARIETGDMTLSPEPVLVGDLLGDVLGLVRPLAAQHSIHLVGGRDASCAEYVFADRQRFQQVLLNLLSNAVKYNRVGGTVAVSCEPSGPIRMRIKVTDTGYGIPQEQLGRLFTPFDRLGAERGEIEGTGIGLSLSRQLAEAMGGTLDVDTVVGQGSTFWVELPLVEGPIERYERLNIFASSDHVDGPPPGDRHAVLYIEDNLANLSLVQRIVAQRDGIEIIPAMQGRLGLELAQEHRPALILLDLHLPDISGDEVLQRLRDDPKTASIPVVMVSAEATPGQVQRLLNAGALAYLTKPIDINQLLQILDDHVLTADSSPAPE